MSKIEQTIDEIEEFVEGCKPAPFSKTNIIVPKEQLYELLTELRLKTPAEIKRYTKIILQKDKIISDAEAQAESMIQETEEYAAALIEEHEIMLKAYAKADETISAANTQAQAIVDAADAEAEATRRSALEYANELITNIQDYVEKSLAIARTNYEGLIGGLSADLDALIENHEALSMSLYPEGAPASVPAAEDEEAFEEEAEEEPVAVEEEDEEEDEDDYEEVKKPRFSLPKKKAPAAEEESVEEDESDEDEDEDEDEEDGDYDDID